jgi:Acyltransferase C-terminus
MSDHSSLNCLFSLLKAYSGYDGSLPSSSQPFTLTTLFFGVLRKNFPREIHIRIKKYSMEEVLHIDNVNWLVKKWVEKDRLLTHFARHQQFPNDSRGYYGRPRVFDTRHHAVESSIGSLLQLVIITAAVPLLTLILIPLSWTVFWIWIFTKLSHFVYESVYERDLWNGYSSSMDMSGRHQGLFHRQPGRLSFQRHRLLLLTFLIGTTAFLTVQTTILDNEQKRR